MILTPSLHLTSQHPCKILSHKFRFDRFIQHWVIACEKSHKLLIPLSNEFTQSALISLYPYTREVSWPQLAWTHLALRWTICRYEIMEYHEVRVFSVVPLLCFESLPVDPYICIIFSVYTSVHVTMTHSMFVLSTSKHNTKCNLP